jgi:DNA polymerase III delta prime subunit
MSNTTSSNIVSKQTKCSEIWETKWRPVSLDDMILLDEHRTNIKNFIESGNNGVFLFAGKPGTGKTTLAKVIVKELNATSITINASADGNIDMIRNEFVKFASTASINGSRKVIIFDEADNMTPAAQLALRGAMSEFGNVTVIMTANYPKRIIPAITESRCITIDFNLDKDQIKELKAQCARRVVTVLVKEGILYEKADIIKLVNSKIPDFRAIINAVQYYSSGGKLQLPDSTDVQDYALESLLSYTINKDFGKVKDLLKSNSASLSIVEIIEYLFINIEELTTVENIPMAVVILHRYQVEADKSVIKQLAILSMITELMGL